MDFNLTVQKRESLGRKAKDVKNEGNILGNVYGKGVESIPIQGERRAMQKVVVGAGKNHPIELTIDGADNHLVLVHEVERDNITQNMHHVTFHVIKRGEKVSTEIPLHLVGDAPAARTGNIVVKMLDEVEIEANPKDIPEAFEISIESLEEVGDSINVGDIKMPTGVTLLTDETLPVVKVEATRAVLSEDEEEAEEGDAQALSSDGESQKEEKSDETTE